MTKENMKNAVQALLNAPTVCAEAKDAACAYIEACGTDSEREAAKRLIDELQDDVMTIDEVIAFFESSAGRELLGKEKAAEVLAGCKESKARGGTHCPCPACAAGKVILDNKAVLLA